jgi:hypothetical protein
MRIVLWALLLAVAWTVAVAIIAQSIGFHSAPGMWAGVFGLPGVVVASWVRPYLGRNAHDLLGYSVRFLVNWIFYCSVIKGLLSMKSFLRVPRNTSQGQAEKPRA